MAMSRALAAFCAVGLAGAAKLSQGSTLGAAAEAHLESLERDWSKELDGQRAGESPVKRVVAVLQKMKSELEEESKKEAEMYDKLVCWCETNTREKTQAVAEAEAKDVALSAEIESRGARFGELSADIASLKQEIADDKRALKEAIALKESSAAQAHKETKDLIQAKNNLDNTLRVLSKQASFVQMDKPLVAGLRVLLRNLAYKHELLQASAARRQQGASFLSLAAGEASNSAGAALLSALDVHGADVPDTLPLKFAEEMVERSAREASASASAAFLQAKAEAKSPAAQSIIGILSQMADDFNAQITKLQAESKRAQEEAIAIIAAKEAQIEAGKLKLDELEGEHASNTKALADAKKALEATRKQRAADVEFLQNLKPMCNDIDAQWQARSSTRGAELTAVSETISILTEDEGRELLARSVSLLQLSAASASASESQAEEASSMRALRVRAVQTLRQAAKAPAFEADDLLAAWRGRSGRKSAAVGVVSSPRAQLSALAVSVQLDSFEKVKQAIDTLVAQLKTQQKEEVDFKAYCTKEFSENEKAQHAKTIEKEDLQTKIDQLAAQVEDLQKEIDAATKQIAATQVAIKKAGETRENENAEYQTIVADQRATQELLKKALARLQDFYVKGKGKAVLVQRKATQEPPVKFNAYKTSGGAGPVLGLLEQIVEDSVKLESEAVSGEAQAQKTYETFVQDSNAVIASLTDSVTLKTKAVSVAQVQKAQAESDLESAGQEFDSLSDYEDDLHSQCDWVLKNFDIRQQARLQEIEAVQAAKAILSGAKGF